MNGNTVLKQYGLWFTIVIVILAAIAFILLINTPDSSSNLSTNEHNESIFSDPNLDRSVRTLLEMPYGKLSPDDLAVITSLNLRGLEIENLEGIENMVNLVELNVRDNNIKDITPLGQLGQLVELNMRDNEVSDITPLSQLHALEKLNLRGNWVEDISALQSLPKLKDVNLRYNRIQDLSALTNKTTLTSRLYLEGNPIHDYSPVASYYQQIKDTDFTLKTARPVFSVTGGFYTDRFELELTTAAPDSTIYYTLDGSEPTPNSLQYSGPITIQKRESDEAVVSKIRTTINTYLGTYGGRGNPIDWSEPPENIFLASVVRAKVFPKDGEPSDTVTHTYFIDEQMIDKYSLPIVSIATDADHFFHEQNGIYVPGHHYSGDGRSTGNYRQKGREWERPVHFEYFEQDGTRGYALNAGARIHGNASSSLPQKSLRILSRDEYGQSWMHYPFFENEPAKEYKRLLLRNSGNDWVSALFRDAFMQRLMEDTNIDIQSSQPVIVFINGEYWGIHNLREVNDEHSFAAKYGVNSDEIDILEKHYLVQEGDWQAYDELIKFIQNHDLADDQHYETIQKMIDIDNLIDYLAAQIYIGNHDWPHNNIRYWRSKNPYNPDAPYGQDGRWRWIIYDTDYGFGLSGNAYNNTLGHAVKQNEEHRIIFVSLFKNEQYKQKFINRFADLLNTTYASERVLALLDETAAMYAPEMDEHIERWKYPVSYERWEQNVDAMRTFASLRTNVVQNTINTHFKLNGKVNVKIELPGEKGTIQINSLTLDNDAPAWEGVYYQNIPITVTAIPASGYEFVGWGENVEETALTVRLSLTEDITLTPKFE